MTSTNRVPAPPEPGDRPPLGRLSRPPSDRYAATPGGGATAAPAAGAALAPAIAAAVGTAVLLVIVGGVLAERSGLLAIAGIGGAAIGLLAANGAVPSGGRLAAMSRRDATRAAMLLALLAIAGGALGTWAYGRLEGGVMDPLGYLWATLGPYVPAEAVIAGLAAAWGAGAGPVRGGT